MAFFSSLDAMKTEVGVRAGTLDDKGVAEDVLKQKIEEMDASIKLVKKQQSRVKLLMKQAAEYNAKHQATAGEKQKELKDEQKQEVRAYGCMPPSLPSWAGSRLAKSCGVVRTCSPTCGRSAWVPNQLRSGMETTNCGAGCGEVRANHKALTGRLN